MRRRGATGKVTKTVCEGKGRGKEDEDKANQGRALFDTYKSKHACLYLMRVTKTERHLPYPTYVFIHSTVQGGTI